MNRGVQSIWIGAAAGLAACLLVAGCAIEIEDHDKACADAGCACQDTGAAAPASDRGPDKAKAPDGP